MTAFTTISLLFFFFTHPLTMALGLVTQAFLVSILVASFAPTPWFSYILFLIFMGAVMVLFIYIAALAANDMFVFPNYWTYFLILVFAMIIGVSTYQFTVNSSSSFISKKSTWNSYSLEQSNWISEQINVYAPINQPLTILVVWFLLLTLLVAATISASDFKPLMSKK
uniref:NADH dehydrogenase subunit 6 n=1 Tax=Anchistus australis TaxID=1296376 RepID=UPI0013E8F8CC|nr:NADH dehydrogenase subunit 6 [Anchistus australis]QHR79564.1 NADH dehydrogenase subunit 6 [Anchistus australis]